MFATELRECVNSVCVAVLMLASVAGCATPPPLLADADTRLPQHRLADAVRPYVLRTRAVNIRTSELPHVRGATPPAPVVLNLFPDISVSVTSWTEESPSTNIPVWRGQTEDPEVHRLSLAVSEGRVVLDLHRASTVFRIEPLPDSPFTGRYIVMEIDPNALPPEAEPIVSGSASQPSTVVPPPLPRCDYAAPVPGHPGAKPQTVRVLVAYTQASPAQTIQQDIALLIDQLNDVWNKSSNFGVRVELAGSHLTPYMAADDFSVDLNRLGQPGDGFADEVHAVRDQTRADLVALLVEGTQGNKICGIAFRPGLPLQASHQNLAFSVVNRTCGLSQFTFAHEIGHNFGMDHDRTTAGVSSGGFNYGHVDKDMRVVSIMSYLNACSSPGVPCTRYPAYSSPYMVVKGRPFGKFLSDGAAEYNMEVLCRGMPVVGKYRQ